MSSLTSNISPDVTIRWASDADAPALTRLAALDSKRLPSGALLVAEVNGEIWAALAPDSGSAIADPFRRSGDLVRLLTTRALQLTTSQAQVPVLRPAQVAA